MMENNRAEAEPLAYPGPLSPEGCYQIIWDEAQVRQFYQIHMKQFENEKWLSFLMMLIARRKYHESMSTTDTTYPRKTFSTAGCVDPTKSREDQFVRELRSYEIALGLYRDKRSDETVPTSALALYLIADPLRELDAWTKTQAEFNNRQAILVNHLLEEKHLDERWLPPRMNVESTFKDRLHASPTKIFKKLDVDTKEEEKIASLRLMMKANGIVPKLVVESRNGYHVVLMARTVCGEKSGEGLSLQGKAHEALHKFALANKDWMTVEKNAMVIIPGTLQGGFPTQIVNWN